MLTSSAPTECPIIAVDVVPWDGGTAAECADTTYAGLLTDSVVYVKFTA